MSTPHNSSDAVPPLTAGELLDRRVAAGLSQRDLAERAGVSVRAIRDIESGRVRRPQAESLRRLAAAVAAKRAGSDQAPVAGPPEPTGPARSIEVAILGPVELHRGDDITVVASGQQRTVLALLALHAGRGVTRDEIVDVLWGGRPPRTAVNLVHIYIGHLRRLLATAGDGADATIARTPGGYQLAAGCTDAERFDRLATEARAHQARGDLTAALDAWREVQRAWRGPVVIDGPRRLRQHPAAVDLQHRRIIAAAEWADLALAAGETGGAVVDVVACLRELVHAEPLHEALQARFMLALAALGDQAGALRHFAETRAKLRDELGIEPGGELSAAHVRVLRGSAAGPVGRLDPVAPAQVPAAVASFTGRARMLSEMDALLTVGQPPGGSASPVVCLVTGAAGVGKSALAIVWAHRVREQFPAGQLYVNLRGYAAESALRPADALQLLLLGLGVRPEQIPTDADAAAALLRSRLSGRRALVLLDDAYSVDQVLPLLPAESRCLVLVTSRHRLDGLVARHDAHRVHVPLLTADESHELLARLLGPVRVRAEPAAARRLADVCEGLPLALRVTSANLRGEPDRRLELFVDELAGGDRLGHLQVAGDEWGGVRRAFDHSYRLLRHDVARVFRLLGLMPGATFAVADAAVLAGVPTTAASRAVDELAAASLIEPVGPGRYTMHDLLRLYAAERATAEESGLECARAPVRLCRHYLAKADEAAQLLNPGSARLAVPESESIMDGSPTFADRGAALAWLDEHRPNLVASVRHAAEHGYPGIAVLMADALRGYFHLRMYLADWGYVASTAVEAARAGHDLAGEAAGAMSLALLHLRTGDRQRALEGFTDALRLGRAGGWLAGVTAALSYLGSLHHMAGRQARAASLYGRAFAINGAGGRTAQQATNLLNLGLARLELGWPVVAARHYAGAGRMYRDVGAAGGVGVSLGNLGETDAIRGRYDRAQRRLIASLEALREVGHRGGQAEVLRCLAGLRRDTGDVASGLGLAQAALELAVDTGHRRAEISCRHTLGTILWHLDNGDGAAGAGTQLALALGMARDDGDAYYVSACLAGLAEARRRQGDSGAARDLANEAVRVARRGAYRLREADALGVLGTALVDAGQVGAARRVAILAVGLLRCAGASPTGPALSVVRATRLG
jgi:DNA-binding SARP family transcriptional activator/tetratricopeptide (TPR) repeat protein/DNA-binding XRE family transcriptional regulator